MNRIRLVLRRALGLLSGSVAPAGSPSPTAADDPPVAEPTTTGWLGRALVTLAGALIAWALLPSRQVRPSPPEDAPPARRIGARRSRRAVVGAAALAALAQADGLRAQEPLVRVEATLMPTSRVTRSLSGPATEARVHILRGSAVVPLVLRRGGLVLVPRISGSRVGIVPRPIDPSEPVWVEALYDLDLELVAQGALTERTSLSVILSPGIASDFRHLRSDHLTVQGAALLTRRTDGPTWGGGLSLTNAFGEVRLVPLAALRWRTDRVRIDVLAPAEGRVLWTAGERMAVGVRGRIDGNVYGLGREGTLQGGRVRYSMADAGPVLEYHLGPGIRLSASAGASFVRRLEVEDAAGERIEDAALAGGWRIGLGISWLLPEGGGRSALRSGGAPPRVPDRPLPR